MRIKFLLFVLLVSLASWQPKGKKVLTHELVRTTTDSIYDKLVKIRRDFHANPELAKNETRTREVIRQYLLDLGMEVDTSTYGHGIIGILKGKKPGRKIAWRAEMDALPNSFPDDVPFKSTVKGVQHGCGHDVHLAIALGIADILAKNKESLAGTAYFIFQPEEETFVGAKAMVAQGLFSKIKPDEIYGLHVTAIPVGKIVAKANEVFAYQKQVRIKLKNEVSKDEAKTLAQKINKALVRVQPNTKPWEIQHIVDPQMGLSNPNTIFKDYLIMDEKFRIYADKDALFMETYLYETNAANLQKIIPKIEQVIEAEKYKDKLLSVSFIQDNPTVINDAKLTEKASNTLSSIYGNDLISPDYGQVPYFNDDFAYFQQKVPGVYFLLGGSDFQKGIIAMNHAPNFKVDEQCIKVGVRSFTSLMIERLHKK
ncbi:amidohydrolase [Chitinophaga pendula]|uniref:M20 metallopeptidase family protein n=1 Tax=Chitinophaga TaxID=79328 RepID=UPI000BB05881|nr:MULTISPECIES: M20 family metallopeptidase [Chitinophaga]ASZ13155.1 amidohydrolase [Chitinophaga sp. MD30]UCJ09220.1 amidohydrolase [Chitinophaga pendula]